MSNPSRRPQREQIKELRREKKKQQKVRPPDLAPWCHGTVRAAEAAWTVEFVSEIGVAPVPGSSFG